MRRLLVLLLFLSPLCAEAQIVIFEAGYVVRGGERVSGMVALGADAETVRGVQFRPFSGGEAQTLGVDVLSGFGTDGGDRFRRVRALPAPGADSLTAFARVLRDGPADLLALWTPDGTRYLIATPTAGTVTLPPDTYASALTGALGACGGRVLTTAAYDADALIEAIDRHNRCLDPDYRPGGDGRPLLETVAALRGPRRPTVSLEAGLGYVTGTFERQVDPFGRAAADPSASGSVLLVAAAVDLIPVAPWFEVVAEAGYTVGALPFGLNRTPLEIASFDLLTVSLGPRVSVPAGSTSLQFRAGLVVGTNTFRTQETVESTRELNTRTGLVRDVPSYDIKGSGGLLVEIGVSGETFPVVASFRYQSLGLSGTRFSGSGDRYSVTLMGGSLRWRLGR